MRTYWLISKTNGVLECFDNLRTTHTDGGDQHKDISNNLQDLKLSPGRNMFKRNSIQSASTKKKPSSEDMKNISCNEIQGYNSSEIHVNVSDSFQSRQSVKGTPDPAPDLLPKVHFETKM